MRRLSLAVLVLGGLALIGLVAVYLALSPSYLAGYIEQSVTSATGRKLVVDGGPHLSLWPQPSIRFKGVKLLDASGKPDSIFAQAEEMEIGISASALLHRRADIQEFRLVRPKLNLVIDRQGHASWDFGGTPGNQSDGVPDIATSATAPIYVEDGSVTFKDERSGKAYRFEHLDFVLTLASPRGPVEMKGSGEWHRDRASFSLYVKSPMALAGEGSPIDFNLSSSRLSFAYSGRGLARNGLELAGQAEARSRSLRELARWAGFAIADGRGLGPVAASGSIAVKDSVLALKKSRLVLDGQNAQGDVTIDLNGDRPVLTARLGVDQIDLNQYAPPRETDAFGPSSVGIEAWSAALIDFSALKAVDATFTINASRLVYGDLATGHVTVDASLKGGVLDALLKDIALYGGTANGHIALDGGGKEPAIEARFDGNGLHARSLMSDFAEFTEVDGRLAMSLDLSASGRSQQAMVSSLGGKAGFRFSDGAIRGADLDKLTRSVAAKVLSGWDSSTSAATPFSSLSVDFTVKDGLAESRNLSLEGRGIKITGRGTVDLLKRELDFKVEPRLTAEANGDFNLVVPVNVVGPWGKPTIYPDIAGILENPAGGYQRLKALVSDAKRKTPEIATPKAKPGAGEAGTAAVDETISPASDQPTGQGALELLKKQIQGDGSLLPGFSSGDAEPAPGQ